eukprot:TRINITY_DN1407_c0_g2_i1.p1 TRINITY_DN1407_c0_g2~~TRINITY_DN1407_c0_g2_i1.p1  ORF type:complete len:778 (-),score=235.27 TRINITY_DN1407_c0_g2_i1:64-2397(-)
MLKFAGAALRVRGTPRPQGFAAWAPSFRTGGEWGARRWAGTASAVNGSEDVSAAASASSSSSSSSSTRQQWKLWMSNVCPVRTHRYDVRYYLYAREQPMNVVNKIMERARLDDCLKGEAFRVQSAETLPRDGGVLMTLETQSTPQSIMPHLSQLLHSVPVTVPLAIFPVAAHHVVGEPFVDDIGGLVASNEITVEVHGSEKNHLALRERLFELLRPYGRIASLSVGPLVKDLNPRTAEVVFERTYSAACARICAHRREILDGTTMHVSYNDASKANRIIAWIQRNPRLMVLIVSIAFFLTTLFIFDPLRVMFCTAKISGRFSPENYDSFKWISGLLRLSGRETAPVFAEREKDELRLQTWLSQPPGSILYVHGAQGTGKSRFARSAKAIQKNNVLLIDVERMIERSDDDFVKQLAATVGFFPEFSFLSWMGSAMDAFTPGTGRAAVTSTTTKTMHILDVMTRSCAKLSEPNPLIIIDGFSVENKNKHENFMKILLEWAEMITESKQARVVFVASSAFEVEGGLAEYIPSACIDELILGDVSLSSAVAALEKQMGHELSEEMVDAVAILGGRFAHLNLLLHKVQGGVSPLHVVDEMVADAKKLVRDAVFASTFEGTKIHCGMTDLWPIIVKLAETDSIPYDSVLLSTFKGNPKPLQSLVRCSLLSAIPDDDGKLLLKAGSPLLQAAFVSLASDPLVRPGIDIQVLTAKIAKEEQRIKAAEEELIGIQKTNAGSGAVSDAARKGRQNYLLQRIAESQEKIFNFETQLVDCEKAVKIASK